MTITDRTIIKNQQKGVFRTSGMSDSDASVGKLHEETFSVLNVAGSPLAEVVVSGLGGKAAIVKSIKAIPAATLATAASNYVTGTIYKRDGAGGAAVSIGSFTTNSSGGAQLTAFQPTSVTLTDSAKVLAAGSIITYALVDNGTTTEVAVTVDITVEYI